MTTGTVVSDTVILPMFSPRFTSNVLGAKPAASVACVMERRSPRALVKPKRATMIRLRPAQLHVFLSPRRFRILAAGRRFGKTFLAKAELLRAANGLGRVAWYVAPNYIQAKRIVWSRIKEMTRPYWASKPSETDLRIDLASGGAIAVRGADAYDSLRGEGLDVVV